MKSHFRFCRAEISVLGKTVVNMTLKTLAMHNDKCRAIMHDLLEEDYSLTFNYIFICEDQTNIGPK